MATITMSDEATAKSARYAASWLDQFIAWLEALPGPTAAAYLGLMLLAIVVSNLQNWLSGLTPVGALSAAQTFWGVFTVLTVWVAGHLDSVAGRAFDSFRPAISPGAMDLDRARYELTTMPARPALVILGASFAFTILYYVSDPVASQIVGLSPAALAIRAGFEGMFTAVMLSVIVHAIRQLRLVIRLHAAADRIDLFHAAPLHAFSRLTSQTGMVLIAIVLFAYAANPVPLEGGTAALWIPWMIGMPVAGVLVFIVPLLGIHGRLVRAKSELQGAANQRLQAVLAELDHDVDTLDLTRAGGLQQTIGSLLQQREILAKLSTWPWSTGTLRAFASAIALPLALFVMQRFLGQLL